ncbi:chromate transporter [Aureibacter tunicatorum]|uniref:Chromate transporter n=1 Tax=Aureibacter tunicatorum TaxID=866807 RepID=A0AAE3XQL7_9BACT|nr:chromate transporter [Aureibacter tunicatorum]MDR6240121.1 chromate transporter [Aureibacter tunicatorum]BDD05998.1 chromate transporter [Aureibacter tunicatorum]
MIYIKLFYTFFKIGLFSFGGGLAMLPLIEHEMLANDWMSTEQFMNIVSISQMTPGAISVNCATYIGVQVGGIPGAIIATAGLAAPSIIIIIALAKILSKLKNNPLKIAFFYGVKPITIALILFAGIIIAQNTLIIDKTPDFIAIAITIASFIVSAKFKVHPLINILVCGIIGLLIF